MPRPPAPFIAPQSGSLEQRLAQVADAINRKADINANTFASISLTDPAGQKWQITVDTSGVLHTAVDPRP